jgi:hypothetical protein
MKEFFSKRSPAIIIGLLMFSSIVGFGQRSNNGKAIIPPDWVRAIDDPNANYFKAIKAYHDFWKTHEKPADEEALMAKSLEQTKAQAKTLSKREVKQQREQDYYRYQCKRFENWVRENKPYVQDDGRILSADERLKLWEQTKKERGQ